MSNDNSPNISQDKTRYDEGFHLVCLIDLLGQNEKMEKWGNSTDSKLTPEILEVFKKTVGVVIPFRSMFEDYFAQFLPNYIDDKVLDSLTLEKQESLRRFRGYSLHTQQFADTFVFYSRMVTSYGDISVRPLYCILGACCWAMISSLAIGVPFRGAVCIGRGLEIAGNTFYGPALAEAHCLETKKAEYPRVVLSERAKEFCCSKYKFSRDSTINDAMNELAKTCSSMLCLDDNDDQVMVDFLGESFHKLIEDVSVKRKIVEDIEKAYQFVCAETILFGADKKLGPRYARLREYMKSRLPIWGLG